MNGAQLLKVHGDTSGLMNGPPADDKDRYKNGEMLFHEEAPLRRARWPRAGVKIYIIAPEAGRDEGRWRRTDSSGQNRLGRCSSALIGIMVQGSVMM
jgi:hypothetical protein